MAAEALSLPRLSSSSRSSSRSSSHNPGDVSGASDGACNQSGASSSASAVDLSAIEQQKENIQPLVAGRSAKALHTLFTSDRRTMQDELREGHEKFNSEIEAVEKDGADDPLDVYHRYVRWTLASYPSGPSHASHLVPLLERATRRFVHDEQYKSDIRLLKLWILYAKYVDCPKDIFRFLEGLQVGVSFASFYEEWAMLEEQSNNWTGAEGIYSLGIARRAQPLDRLKKRRDAFKARMALPRPPTPENKVESSKPATSVRPVLGKSGSSAAAFRGTAASAASTKQALPNNGAAGFAVFKDGEESSNPHESQDGWKDFGTNASRRRENEHAAVPWKGETLSMAGTAPRPAVMRIEVFRDDDAEVPSAVRPESDGLAVKGLRGPAEAEQLRKNPFKYYSEPVQLQDAPQVLEVQHKSSADKRHSEPTTQSKSKTSSTTSRTVSKSTSSTTTKKAEKVASPLHDIYPDGASGLEFSFEEIIAAKRGMRQLRSGDLDARYDNLSEWEHEVRWKGTSWRLDRNGEPILRDATTGQAMFEYLRLEDQKAEEERLQAERAAQAKAVKLEAERAAAAAAQTVTVHRPPSPTINTKAALEEVNAMFSKTMRFDEPTHSEQDSNSDTESSSSDDDGFEQATPLVPSQAETDDTFWANSQAQSQGQSIFSSQPVFSQVSVGSDSGETTEESDADDLTPNLRTHVEAPVQMGMSRSASSSSTSSNEGSAVPGSSRFTMSRTETVPIDENAMSAPRSRPAFRPARTPLAAKGLSAPKQALRQRHEEEDLTESKPESKPRAFDIFSDDAPPQPVDDDSPSAASQIAGFAMGRRVDGNNRFANMMDIMTPITERTCEFGMATVTINQEHGGELRAMPAVANDDEVDEGFDQAYVEDLASSRGSNWEAGRRLAQLDEEEDVVSPPGSPKVAPSALSDPAAEPLPCNPHDKKLIELFMEHPEHPLMQMTGFVDRRHTAADLLDGLQKMAKARRQSGGSRSSGAHEEAGYELVLHKDAFSVREKLGEGGYGAVFRVEELRTDSRPDEEEDGQIALKVEKPTNLWEFFILNILYQRLDRRARESLVIPRRLYAFEDESHMLLDYCDQGTLLDAVNHAHEAGASPAGASSGGLEEVVAIFFTTELMRILESFHSAGFLHGDFKIDNCMLRLEDVPGGARAWTSGYKRDGTGGWSRKGLRIIDFGRTIDLQAFPAGQTFLTNWKTDKHDCAEIAEGRPWTYQPDYYGLACIAHVLLFGKYLETAPKQSTQSGPVRYGIKEPFRRYHQTALWTRFFDALLNPCLVKPDGSLPIASELGEIRQEMEIWLEANSEKAGKNLRSLLKKLEIQALQRSRK